MLHRSLVFLVILKCMTVHIFGFSVDSASSHLRGIDGNNPKVLIPSLGEIFGSRMTSSTGRKFSAFRGVPYAEPPVGQLRFKEPVPIKAWIGQEAIDASKEGPFCILYDVHSETVRGTEDCLKLNVYTHEINSSAVPSRPVMVYIHGGSWSENSGNGETGLFRPDYFLDRDVVLVTINYRLEALGFLSTDDKEAPGNYGLLDQSLALRWVRDHIANFGGDPESITIFGQSAGGASIEFHLVSPHSKGLSHNLDRFCAPGRLGKKWESTVKCFQNMLGTCPTNSSDKMLECLREKSADEIIGYRKSILTMDMYPLAFSPRIDAERESPFLPEDPRDLIRKKEFNSVPIIMGATENEAAFGIAVLLAQDGKNMKLFKEDPIKYMRYFIGVELLPDGYEIAQKVHDQYLNRSVSYDLQLREIEQMMSDLWFYNCIDESVNLFTEYNEQPVYYYSYAHKSRYNLAALMGAPPDIDLGVGHSAEIFMMFPNRFFPSLIFPNDIKVSKTLLDLWTSFAKNGVPASESVTGGWQPMEMNVTQYLLIDGGAPKMTNQSMPFKKRLAFWREHFRSIIYCNS